MRSRSMPLFSALLTLSLGPLLCTQALAAAVAGCSSLAPLPAVLEIGEGLQLSLIHI